jgi:hypothetical protein
MIPTKKIVNAIHASGPVTNAYMGNSLNNLVYAVHVRGPIAPVDAVN